MNLAPEKNSTALESKAMNSYTYYLNQIRDGFAWKAVWGTVAGVYAEHLSGDWVLVVLLFVAVLMDLIFGVRLAIADRCFSVARLGGWVVKCLTYNLTILLIGLVNASLVRTSGFDIPILDFSVTILLMTEVMSILSNMKKLGLPVPGFVVRVIDNVHKKTSEKLDKLTSPEENKNHDPEN